LGLSIAISGGITAVVLVVIMGIIFVISYQINTESTARSEIFDVNDSILKTGLQIQYVNTSSGTDIINFDLVNVKNEKLWEYDKFDLLVTYDADISGTKTRVTEQFTFNDIATFSESEGQAVKTIRQIIKCSGTHSAGNQQNIDLVTDCGGRSLVDGLEEAIAFMSFRHQFDADHSETWRSFNLTSLTNLAINALDATPNEVNWEAIIVEFNSASDIDVQHETFNFQAAVPDIEKIRPINTINPNESMLVHAGHVHFGVDTSIGTEELDRIRILDDSNWAYFVQDFPNTGPQDNNVQIADLNDASVFSQRGIATMTGSTYTVSSDSARSTSGFSDYTQIDRTRTLLFVSYAGFDNPDDFTPVTREMMVRATLDSNNDIIITRESLTNDIHFAWELVQYSPTFLRVEHGVETQSDGTGNTLETVTPVGDLANSFAIGTVSVPFGNCNGSIDSDGDGHIDRGQCTINLESINEVRFIRDDNLEEFNVGYQVVEFLSAGACVGGNPSTNLSVNEWTINCIMGDFLDPGIINTGETAEISLKLQYPIYSSGFIEISISNVNGKTDSKSLVL